MTPTPKLTEEIDYSFRAQMEHYAANWKADLEEFFGMPYEEILKDKELVAMLDAELNRTFWDMATSPSPWNP